MDDTIRVLVVDDESDVRESILLSLASRFRTVRGVKSAQEALRILCATDRPGQPPFTVVLADEHMPGLSGSELLCLLQTRGAPVGRVLMSGANAEAVGRAAVCCGADGFLHKPFTLAELATALDMAHRCAAVRAAWNRGAPGGLVAPSASAGHLGGQAFIGELVALLQQAGHLTPRMREALQHRLSGCTVDQTADEMGCSKSNVRGLCSRAYQALGADSLQDTLRVVASVLDRSVNCGDAPKAAGTN